MKRSAILVFGCLGPFLIACCSDSPEPLTATQFLEQNSSILDDLGGYDQKKRSHAINLIKDQGKEQGSSICLRLLMEKEIENYRAEVVLARILADWRDKRAMAFLVNYLGLNDQGAVLIAKEGLMVFKGEPRLIEVLTEQIESPVLNRRRIATEILAAVGDHKAIALFGERYMRETDREIRALFLFAIGKSQHPKRTGYLIDALTDSDDGLRHLAWNQLRGEKSLPPVDFDPQGSPGERADAVGRLRLWWKARNNT